MDNGNMHFTTTTIAPSFVSLTPTSLCVPYYLLPPLRRRCRPPTPPVLATYYAPTPPLRMAMLGGGGLTEDGDFAILGINASEDDEEEDDEDKEEDDDDDDEAGADSSLNIGTSIGWQGVGNMLFDESLLMSGNVDMGTGPTKRYKDFRGNDIVSRSGDCDPSVKRWLSGILPSLNTYDLEAYAEGLSNIGFVPSCPSMCELTYDDLHFMKVLHRRYLYREITGEGHPFEP